ncbi:MAG: hypothetical protein WA211_09745 [Candidatus Acidiferrales bacterium]|jgi:hypothetical protein
MTENSHDQAARNAAISVVVALALGLLAVAIFARLKWRAEHTANLTPQQQTAAVAIDLLPSYVKVFEEDGYSHAFSSPSDAINGELDGEFTVDPRPQTQVDMLLVTAAGMKHWRDFLSSAAGAGSKAGSGELLYRTGNTNAEYFQIKLTPGDYVLVFDYGPSTQTKADHYVDLDALGRICRLTRTKITLRYDLPLPR